MSRPNHERTSRKRSKMDRYTEDLKYSLRRRLSESVGKGSLSTDDILARSHRQIVADFTDPRQWYYSATHDYIIALMRESQKQNGGSVWGSGSQRGERGSSTSRGHSSPSMIAKEGRHGRHKGSFIEIPTATFDDLQEIRGSRETGRDGDTSDTELKEDKKSGRWIGSEGDANSTQTSTSKDNTNKDEDNGISFLDCFVPGRISPEGKSNIASKQDATDSLHVNTDQDISVSLKGCTLSDMAVSTNTSFDEPNDQYNDTVVGMQSKLATDSDSTREASESATIVEEYNVSAMEAYRASKENQNSYILSKVPTASVDTHCYFPGRLESFVPAGKRSKPNGFKTAVSLPQIGKAVQTEQPESHRTNLCMDRRGRVGTRKRRLCPLTSLERISDKTGDIPYVEDWIRKLQISGKDLVNDKHLKPIERVDETFPHLSQELSPNANASLQLMDLPSDFKPVTRLQPFQPHPSLYLYSLKQKSDLNVKLQYLDIPKPVKQLTDPGIQQKQSFKDDLIKARSKVNYIENRLGDLYRTETNLYRIVSRPQIKPLKKQNGRFLDITKGLNNHNSDSYLAQDRPTSNPEEYLPKNAAAKGNGNLSNDTDEGQSKMKTISLALSSEEPPSAPADDGPTNTKSKSPTHADFHATSTSSWKQQHPVSPGKPKDGKAVERKILRIFNERGDGNNVGIVHQTAMALKNDQEKVIAHVASVQDCNAPGPGINPNTHDHEGTEAEDEELAEDKTGSRLSVVVLEVLNGLMDRLESPEYTMNHQLSNDVSGTSSTADLPVPVAKDGKVTKESGPQAGKENKQQTLHLQRLCSFCDEPHEITNVNPLPTETG